MAYDKYCIKRNLGNNTQLTHTASKTKVTATENPYAPVTFYGNKPVFEGVHPELCKLQVRMKPVYPFEPAARMQQDVPMPSQEVLDEIKQKQ